MSDAFAGEIRMFAGTKPPANWHLCDGSLLQINSNQILFALIGKTYGGDGIQTFAVPDLRSRVPVGMGTGPGLTARVLAQADGQEQVALTTSQIPSHTHPLLANPVAATLDNPGNALFANSASSNTTAEAHYLKPGASVSNTWTLNPAAIQPVGSGAAHENRMACVGMNFIICLVGIYPNFN